jgi:hypothetical protein
MNKALRITLIVIGSLVVAGGLVFAGTWIGVRAAYHLGWQQPAYRMTLAPAQRYGASAGVNGDKQPSRGSGYGMMGSGYGMTIAPALRSGASAGVGGGRRTGSGMMGGYNNNSATPLTVDQAYQAVGKYLTSLNNPDLKIAEVMVFDNNAYVRVVEKSTGIGAFELLVDPASLAIYPEHGPNMMWNLKYAGLNHQNMMGGRGGMMGGMTLPPALRSGASAGVCNSTFSNTPATVSVTMPLSSIQALQAAQQYLDKALPGTKTAEDADPFYGYYTIDILRDGKIIGMLSVNGFTSQVFMHTWHGTFIATQDY